MLNVTWKELEQDQTNALEFDQSQLFRKVYESEFGHPGGQPFGVLLGDYEVRHRRGPDHPQDDIEMLERIAEVAAAAFAPFIAGAHPVVLRDRQLHGAGTAAGPAPDVRAARIPQVAIAPPARRTHGSSA